MAATKNDGKDAEQAWLDYWRAAGGIVERFWDAADLRGRNGGRAVGAYAQPSDFLLTKPDGRLSYAEVKSTVHETAFSFSNIKNGQSAAALKQAIVGGPYDFYIFSYHLGKWFVMPCKQYALLVGRNRRSIKFSELEPWHR